MDRKIVYLLTLIPVLILCGCASMGENAKKGSVAGGILGAATGAIIGHQSGETGEGAAIGAAAGALGGGLIGNQMDKSYYRNNPQHVPITKVADMASKGVPNSVIINEMKRTQSRYRLTSEGITYLKRNNVSDSVIDYMLSTIQ